MEVVVLLIGCLLIASFFSVLAIRESRNRVIHKHA